MVDYTNEIKRLRNLQDDFLLRYGTTSDSVVTDAEIRDARSIKLQINNLWELAVRTSCKDSENELVEMESALEALATKKKYSF